MATIERGWRRLVDRGRRALRPPAGPAAVPRGRPGRSDDGVVRLDPDFLLEQVALAPGEFELRARNPARSVASAATTWSSRTSRARRSCARTACAATARSPTSSASSSSRTSSTRSTRRAAMPCEPTDLPLDSRHLDMQFARSTLSDKPHMGALFAGSKARDCLEHGGDRVRRPRRDRARRRRSTAIANVNSPLSYDARWSTCCSPTPRRARRSSSRRSC